MMHALDMDDCALMIWDDVDRTVEVQVDVNRANNPERITTPGTRLNLSDYPSKLRALEKREVVLLSVESLELSDRERRSPSTLEQALVDSQILDENKRGIFSRLRNLRNAAAHASDFDLDSGSAIIYAGSANRLAEYLRKA